MTESRTAWKGKKEARKTDTEDKSDERNSEAAQWTGNQVAVAAMEITHSGL